MEISQGPGLHVFLLLWSWSLCFAANGCAVAVLLVSEVRACHLVRLELGCLFFSLWSQCLGPHSALSPLDPCFGRLESRSLRMQG